jgi:hypothetical protein
MVTSYAESARSCDHNAIFKLTYLYVTQEYRRTVDADAGFFANTRFVNNENAVFAGYYFRAYDDWYGGRQERVPPAWRVAFRSADERAVSGSGNLLLGINAHVNRDLPLVLAKLGLHNDDRSTRKPDHDKVNIILNRIQGAILAEAARRFDPTIFNPSDPTGLSGTAFFQLLQSWREAAWRNAERLAAARTDTERRLVEQTIEDAALAQAQLIRAQAAYVPPLTSAEARDAHCRQHVDDPVPSWR